MKIMKRFSFLPLPFVLGALHAQTFDVVSVKLSLKPVGKDYNNQITIGAASFVGRNVTLKRMIEEAYGIVPSQIFGGPKWLDESEYDVDAKAGQPTAREQLRKMLQPVLASRFHLVVHRETRELKVYELVADKDGPKIQPVKDGEGTSAPPGSPHFHGDLQELANLISVQLTIVPVSDADPSRPSMASGTPIPVFNKTGLGGIYDFDINRERADPFTAWQRLLQGQLGLRLEGRKSQIEGIAVDAADRVPVSN